MTPRVELAISSTANAHFAATELAIFVCLGLRI